MDIPKMRLEFETQLKDYAYKIKQGEDEIAKLKEYKLKLEGGLETINLLDKTNTDVTDCSNTSQPSD